MLVPTLVTAVSLALGLSGAPARTATHARVSTEPSFFITGRGWGHGIGLSQYGAYGYALRGFKWDRIVTHYYKGTTVAQAPVRRVRVLLARGRANVKISSKQPFAVTDAEGNRFTLQAGAYTFGPGFKLKVEPDQPPQALPGPLLFEPGAAPLAFGDRGYRGSLRVIKEGTRLQIVNVVGLEPYLWGVVPSEMPKTWAAEALKAQAVVARSYAVSRVRRGGTFDLFPDTRSQVYLGIRHEAPSRSSSTAVRSRTRSSSRPRAAARRRSRTCGRAPSRSRISSRSPTPSTGSRRTMPGAPSAFRRPSSLAGSRCPAASSTFRWPRRRPVASAR
jgi:stage II sporulation protein D